MTSLLFFGDIVGEVGVSAIETRLPALRASHQPDFIIANAENAIISNTPGAFGHCGMSPELNERLFAAGVDLITGGNHSWDGPYGRTIHDDRRVLRPLNYGAHAPGRGAAIVEKQGARLGVINLVSKTALTAADQPLAVLETQLLNWADATDLILIDFHGESVHEKVCFGFAVDGMVSAVLGTHTHVQTLDTRILPAGTAYVTDVGMVGPGGGVQGYAPALFANSMRLRLHSGDPFAFASGDVEVGAVLVHCEGRQAVSIMRV
jgi:metallophosphoesterase (TIGR00282 family)